MDRTYLQWNVVNWITVTLMASLGAVFVSMVIAGLKTVRQPSNAE